MEEVGSGCSGSFYYERVKGKSWWDARMENNCLLVKGLNVNAGKTKLMVGGGVVSEFRARACEVCSMV